MIAVTIPATTPGATNGAITVVPTPFKALVVEFSLFQDLTGVALIVASDARHDRDSR